MAHVPSRQRGSQIGEGCSATLCHALLWPGGSYRVRRHGKLELAFPASLGTIAQRLDYNFEMGLGHSHPDEEWPGVTLNYRISEEPARARFRRWLEFMEASSWDDIHPVKKDKK
ncbi:MAG: hypothetical protein CM1200mP22_31330 [Dehalococcoidia bacterium]|nr:MAG: hypothetical protein CM1200mP22_31330 [Dehalococcoidia bacterium]